MRQVYQRDRVLFYADNHERLPSWEFFTIDLPTETLATATVFHDSGKVVTYELVPKLGQPPVAETLNEFPNGGLVVLGSDGLDFWRGIGWVAVGTAVAVGVLSCVL